MNGYKAFWNGKNIEVEGYTSYEASRKAQLEFQLKTRKCVKVYDITVILCEKQGEQVEHKPLF